MATKAMVILQTVVFLLLCFESTARADSVSVASKPAATQKYFEIIEGPAKVLQYLNPQSPLLGLASSHETFPLISAGTSWCRILFKGDTGWIETPHGKIIDTPTVISAKLPGILVLILICICVALVLTLGCIFVVSSLRRQKFKRYALRRDVLVISHSEKEIRYSLTDIPTTVSKCFSEIGFKVTAARDIDHARNLLMHYSPDVLMVDWKIERNIQSKIASILSAKDAASTIIVIFFNVPDPAEMSRINQSASVHYIGLIFSDRDIFKIVTPLIMAGQTSHTFKKSVQSSALEGEIGSGNLVEVMQFIEIGKKTGCLYITSKSPAGIIYFEQGRITYAAARLVQGREAINEILNMREGRFHFVLDKVSSTKNLNCSTLEVLMEWTKNNDEARRH